MSESEFVRRDELPQLIREALAQIIGIDPPSPKSLPTKQAYKELGYEKGYQLTSRTGEGKLYRPGIEVEDRRSPDSGRACYFYDIEACKKRQKLLPEKRN